jgi:hypothetical protein
VGTATYNATLCATYGATNVSPYCQAGTATYNPTLCSQSTSAGGVCDAGTATYSGFLCAQYAATQPAEVVLRSNASGIDCGKQATLTLRVTTSTGSGVPDGTTVALVATAGVVTPPQVTTVAGNATAIYSAPLAGTGPVVVTGTAGGKTGSTIMALNCAPAAPRLLPTPAAAVAPLPAASLPAAAQPVTLPASLPQFTPSIIPPNTGDGGLLP